MDVLTRASERHGPKLSGHGPGTRAFEAEGPIDGDET